ncbi:hypothetical protein B0H14DRAFT_2647760 [Mycena olivaceomarginata]|nr:hypothetical protein B0H14DRAFT_2647760 [Mycena olivaceomarginata]
MTKKRSRERRRAQLFVFYLRPLIGVTSSDTTLINDKEQPTPAKKPKKSKHVNVTAVDIDYAHYDCIVGPFLGPFEDITQIIEYGTTADCAMSGDEGRWSNERLAKAYLIHWQKFPGFRKFLLKLTNKSILCRAVEQQLTFPQINSGIEAVRTEDTSTLKPHIHLYLNKDPTTPLDPVLPNLKDKIHRGYAHPVFTQLLTPIHWEANNITYNEISESIKTVIGVHIPRFIFPINQVFPVNATADDPASLDVLDKRMQRGDLSAGIWCPIRVMRNLIYFQIYFTLSTKQEWHKTDGNFNYEEFFWSLFDDGEWAEGIITLWNKSSQTIYTRCPGDHWP